MKAIVHRRYGPPSVLQYEDVEKPVPKKNEVLLKISAAALNPLDWHFLRGLPYFVRIIVGFPQPKLMRLGVDLAGQVEAVGSDVASFKPGDLLFGAGKGAFAEFACAAESSLIRKPDTLTFEQAASVPIAACSALQGLRDKGKMQPGQQVLINGAAGGVGTFAVQIARALGARVTAVCSTNNLDLVRSLGADRVIDYTREDFTQGAQLYDLILDCIGNHPTSALSRILSPKGICVGVGGTADRWMLGPIVQTLGRLARNLFSSRKFLALLARVHTPDLSTLSDLLQSGKVTPVIDRSYPLRDLPQAIAYLEQGHARGKVVITTTPS